MLEIDGSYGEGGGQLLRLAVALSAITGIDVRIRNIRARRSNPGLAPQHLAGVRAVGKLCAARITGLDLRSQLIMFEPAALRGGVYHFDIGTAGSITLVLQALIPVMLSVPAPCKVRITGGTDIRQAPAADYLCPVLVWLIRRLGAQLHARVLRRGYYPRGGGEIEVDVQPARLVPRAFDRLDPAGSIHGIVHVANLPEHVALRMERAACERLAALGLQVSIERQLLGHDAAVGTGGAIVCWAECGQTVLGAARVAERGVRAEALGEAVGVELMADLATGAGLDVHAADQLLVFLALAGGGSFSVRSLSLHARTAIWLIEQFLPVTFEVVESAGLAHVSVTART